MSETNDVPAANWMPSALDKEADALISDMEKEFAQAPESEPEAIDAAPSESSTSSGEPGDTPANLEQGIRAETSKPEQLSDFVKRELDIFRREEAIRAREEKYSTLEQELLALRSRQVPDDVVEAARLQPTATLEAMGFDVDLLVKSVLAERMGEKAPEDLRLEVKNATRDAETNRKIRALEQKIQEQERTERARAYYQDVQTKAKEFLSTPGLSEYAPTLAQLSGSNIELAHAEIMGEITRDAEVKAMRAPNEPLLTYEQAAKRVESRLGGLSRAFGAPKASTTTPQTPGTANIPVETKKPPAASVKSPDRPIAPWLQPSTDIEAEGMKAAIAEFHRTK